MSLKLSTGLRNGMLNATGFKEAFTAGVMYIYSGPQPVNADAAIQGTLLGIVSLNAGSFSFGSPTNGLNFDAPANGVISKAAAETWKMIGIAASTAGWFRLMGNPSDNLASSNTLPRLDGSVAISGGDLNLSTVAIVIGTPVTIDVFQFTLPAS